MSNRNKPSAQSSRQMMSSASSLARKPKSMASMNRSQRSILTNGLSNPDKIEKPSRFGVTVLDEQGNDVTPKPLYEGAAASTGGKQSKMLLNDGTGTPTDPAMSFASLFQTATQSIYAQPFGKSTFEGSGKSSLRSSFRSFVSSDEGDAMMNDGAGGDGAAIQDFGDVTMIHRQTKEEVSEADLGKMVHIILEETETFWFYGQDGVSILPEAEDRDEIKAKNEKYRKLCAARYGNDLYAERGMQTFEYRSKHKDVQASKVGQVDVACTATTWDMYDTYEGEDQPPAEAETSPAAAPSPKKVGKAARAASATTENGDNKKLAQSSVVTTRDASLSSATTFKGFDTNISIVPEKEPEKPETLDVEAQWKSLMEGNPDLNDKLLVVERIVTENIYQPKLAVYREMQVYPALTEPDEDEEDSEDSESEQASAEASAEASGEKSGSASSKKSGKKSASKSKKSARVSGEQSSSSSSSNKQQRSISPPKSPSKFSSEEDLGPAIERLWAFTCPLTQGRNVSCFSWNKSNPDLLAVGYGSFSFVEQNKGKPGVACCWNLKNLAYPERIFTCKANVSALDFSSYQPNLLAVGCSDGTVSLFNARNPEDQHVLDTFDCVGKHSSPVWQLKWVERENHAGDKSEKLISTAADGRVVEWLIRKGLECVDLMKLKRKVSKPNPLLMKKKEKPEALISRQAPGMSFDFHPKEKNNYLAGTEEGLIHKCSCSYNEQFLESYHGHTSAVYKVLWSPFNSDIFLSCSADWSLKVWTQKESRPLLNLLSNTKAVHDISWSPYSSTVFCAVNEGAIEIWDLSLNILDPIVVKMASPGTLISSCIFSHNSNSVVVGDTDGNVTFYYLKNVKGTDTVDQRGEDANLTKVLESSQAPEAQ